MTSIDRKHLMIFGAAALASLTAAAVFSLYLRYGLVVSWVVPGCFAALVGAALLIYGNFQMSIEKRKAAEELRWDIDDYG